MKRSKAISIMLILALMAGLLSGCAPQEPVSAQASTVDPANSTGAAENALAAEQEEVYAAVPETNETLDTTDQALVPTLLFKPLDLDFLEVLDPVMLEGRVWFHGRSQTTEYACSILPDGTDLQSLALMDWTSEYTVNRMAFAPDRICYSTTQYIWIDRDAGQADLVSRLYCLDGAGNQLFALDLSDGFGLEPAGARTFVNSIAFAPDGTVLFATEYGLYHLDHTGQVLASRDIQATGCTLVQGNGQVFLVESYESSDLRTLDLQTLKTGEVIFHPGREEFYAYYAGETDTDLYGIRSGEEQKGVFRLDLTGQAAPEPVIPAEYWTSNLGRVFPAGADRWLCVVSNMTNGSSKLYLARLDLAPEKTLVTIGVAHPDDNFLDLLLYQYNFDCAAYQFQTVLYSDEELRAALLTGDLPDLLLFDDTNWPTMNEDTCARAGMLVDLKPLLERVDSPLTRDMLLPNLISAQEQNGGLFTLAYGFYYRTIYTRAEYGAGENWTLEAFLSVAKGLPDGVVVQEDIQTQFLQTVLEWCLPRFVDEEAGTCDFETPLFYDLLELCRDRFPAEWQPDTFAGVTDSLLNYITSLGSLSMLCTGLEQFSDAAVFSGFPDASGGMLTLGPRLAITTACPCPEAAWDLVAYVVNNMSFGVYLPTTEEGFTTRVERARGNYSDETLDRAEAMIRQTTRIVHTASIIPEIAVEEAEAFFAGDKTAQEVARLIQSRVGLYLAERS